MGRQMITAFFDGICEPINPFGHTGYGFVIFRRHSPIFKDYGYVGHGFGMTNNVGEASGLLAVMKKLLALGMADETILIRGDSKIVIHNMRHPKRTPNGYFAPYIIEARTLLPRFRNITFEWIPREQNGIADSLSKKSVMGRPWTEQHRSILRDRQCGNQTNGNSSSSEMNIDHIKEPDITWILKKGQESEDNSNG